MSHAIESDERVTDKRTLIEYLEQGCRPKADWRIGTEHEKIGYQLDDLRPLPYEGDFGICAMLKGLQRFDWLPVFERGNVIALTKDGQSISLEPGGQFELSVTTWSLIQASVPAEKTDN